MKLTLNMTAESQIAEVDTTANNIATRTAAKIEAKGFDVAWSRSTGTVKVGHTVKSHKNAVGYDVWTTEAQVRWTFIVTDPNTLADLGTVVFTECADHTVGSWGFTAGLKELLKNS